ncbi:MAG: hypothetical protein J2P26_00475 [Nocardiopsaceae bacterium]|nr:hypothetical protein [Nocardiopsaceae bacterium]
MTTSATTIPRPRGTSSRGGPARCALRPVVVAADLAALRGPDGGLAELPQRLFWSGPGRVFDLADPDQALEMYEAVFDAARSEADLADHINGGLLARLWPDLALAPRVRRAWEAAHPALALGTPAEASATGNSAAGNSPVENSTAGDIASAVAA